MQNTSHPASLLTVARSTEKKSLVSDTSIKHFPEMDKTHFSRLYRLFFEGASQYTKQPELQQAFTGPDEYSSYE